MLESKAAEMSWDPRARAEASAWQQWEGGEVKKAGKSGAMTGRAKDPQSVVVRYEGGGEEDVTFEALAGLMAAAVAIPRSSSRRGN
jgi:hypothetical protein